MLFAGDPTAADACRFYCFLPLQMFSISPPQVPGVTGELAASGAARSLQATVSARIESDFYNARLMAWEPLMEPWGARLELDVETYSGLSAAAETGGRISGGARRNAGSRRRPSGQGGRATGRTGGGDAPVGAGTLVGVRLVSDEVLDVNLTESLVENLAAVAHAQQRQEESQKLARGWAGDGGDNSFSLHWLRNETGLPVVCSAHCRESRGSGSGGGGRGAAEGNEDAEAALPVRVPAGEEAPMGGSLGLPLRAVVLEFEERGQGRERGAGGASEASAAGMATATAAVTKSWRSLRPIDLDVVGGQRLTTMVAATAAASSEDADRLQSSKSALGASSSWRSGTWTWAARAASAAGGSSAAPGVGGETVKVVTEVESHHGVKVTY